jgi:hypothetical protein
MTPDPRKHRRPAALCNQHQRRHSRLPFRRLVLGLRKLCDVGPGILERDELATAGKGDWIVEPALPIRRSAVTLRPDFW